MSEISAIYIIQYLDNFNKIVTKHNKLYKYLKEQLTTSELPIKLFPSFHDTDHITPSCFCLLIDNYDDNLRLNILENDIFCRKYYHPLKNTKNAVEIYNNILCLPCNIDMENSDIDKIISLLKSV